LEEGLWELLIGRRDGPRETAVNAVLDHGLLRTLPLIAEGGGKRYRVGVLGYELAVLAVERALAPEEQGGFRQRSLRSSLYPARRARGLENVVLYDCFGGRSYSDSPRAVHEELVRREAPYEHLWVVQDGVADLPDTVVPVRELSREYYDAYARARYIVANDHWPRWFVRRPKQVCIQTWHGAPLKRQGRDLAQWHPAFRAYRRFAAQRAENWQYVVSPGPFATPIVERAFPVGGEVLETGLPRTDALVSADRERRADEVRRRLGLDGRRVVLYAPTYRDQLDYRAAFLAGEPRDLPTYRAAAAYRDRYRMGRLLDFEGLHAGLPDDHVVLFRKHPRVVDPLPVDARPFARDVSDFPDLVELLLVADVLVTDYASLLFDFASTGRPIVFFAPDVDDYRDETRGFSLDFEAIAPGPLLHTTEEVVAALNDLGAVRETFRERYDSFVASFCPLADGKAAARLVDRTFRS
jgi:CDP-glycerol glycerophosphotransferase